MTWQGQPAVEYLHARLEGEDGEDPWTLAKGAKEVSRKLRIKVSEQTLSKWHTKSMRAMQERERYEDLVEVTTVQLAKQAETGLALKDVVDAQVVLTIGKVYANEGVDEAVKFIRAMTDLKRSITAENNQTLELTKYRESTEALRATIDRLTLELKSRGYDPAALDELNKQVVGEVDKMILSHRKEK
jgi:hypothetical protein